MWLNARENVRLLFQSKISAFGLFVEECVTRSSFGRNYLVEEWSDVTLRYRLEIDK